VPAPAPQAVWDAHQDGVANALHRRMEELTELLGATAGAAGMHLGSDGDQAEQMREADYAYLVSKVEFVRTKAQENYDHLSEVHRNRTQAIAEGTTDTVRRGARPLSVCAGDCRLPRHGGRRPRPHRRPPLPAARRTSATSSAR